MRRPGDRGGDVSSRSSGSSWQPRLSSAAGQRTVPAAATERPAGTDHRRGRGHLAFAGQVLAPALTGRCAGASDAAATTDIVSSPRESSGGRADAAVSLARSGGQPESTRPRPSLTSCCRRSAIWSSRATGTASWPRLTPSEPTRSLVHAGRGQRPRFAMTSSFTCMLLAAQLALDPDGPVASTSTGSAQPPISCWPSGPASSPASPRAVTAAWSTSAAARSRAGARGRAQAARAHRRTGRQLLGFLARFRHGPKAVRAGHALRRVRLS